MLGKYIFYYIIIILVFSYSAKRIEDINNICKKINIKHYSHYKTAKEFFENINYNFDSQKNNPKIQKLYNFLFENQLEEIEEFKYFIIIKNYLINIYIIPIILLWIIFIILFFKKISIFKASFHLELISKFYLSIIIIILFLLISILSMIILGKINHLNYSMNETFCNLLKFFYELNRGKIKEKELNYSLKNNYINDDDLWPGLYDLNSILLDSSEAINKISINENKTFLFLDEINRNIEKYKDAIKLLIETASKKLPNPNSYENDDILTRYSNEFIDISKDNSFINIIHTEFTRYIYNATELINSLNSYCSYLSKKNDFYDLELNNFFDNISDFSSSMKEASLNINNNIITFQEHSELLLLITKLFYFFSFILSLFIIILIILYCYKNLLWIRICFHICWNLGFLLIIFTICNSYFFSSLGETVYNIIYIIEKEILNTDQNIFFNTCINTEKSDLKEILDIYDPNSVLIEINSYYKKVYPIIDKLNNLEQEIPKLEGIKKVSNYFSKYINNYELSTNSAYKNSDVSYVLKDLSNITNNFGKSKQDSLCDSNDIWVSSRNNCKDFIYINKYDIKNKLERKIDEKYCFIIQDNYKESDIKNLYEDICTEKAYNKIFKYITGLTKYYNSNENLLNSLQKIWRDIKGYNKKLSGIILEQINNCQNDISDLIEIYNPILGMSNITNLFKCGRLKRKIINFYDISYNQIFYFCKFIKLYTIVIIIFQFFGNILIIIHNKENKEIKEIKRKYFKMENKDLNHDGVELIEEVPGEDEDI